MSTFDDLRVSEKPIGKAARFLQLLFDQQAITVGQFTHLLKVPRKPMERFLYEAEEAQWIGAKQFLTGDDVWSWLDYRGMELVGGRFQVSMPAEGELRKIRLMNEARIQLEKSPRPMQWKSRRKLRGEQPGMSHPPDAVVVMGDKEYVVEVELNYKRGRSLHSKYVRLEDKYEGVFCCAPPDIAEHLRQKGLDKRGFPRVWLVPIEVQSNALDRPEWRVGNEHLPPVEPNLAPLSDDDLATLDLFAEQGAIPRDQLKRLLSVSDAEVDRIFARYLAMDLIECAKPLVNEPYWGWLTSVGTRLSRHDLVVQVPGVGNLERMRALNELRILATRNPKVRWTSDRVLRSREGVRGSCPDAVVEIGDECHAFDIVLYAGNHSELRPRLERRLDKYGVMVWFYAPEAQADLEKFAESVECPGLTLRPLPKSSYLEARAWNRKRAAHNEIACCSQPKLWAELARNPVAVMYPIVIESVPLAATKVIAVAAGIERQPRILGAWKRKSGGYPVYYLETDVGKYRVVQARSNWQADEIAREDVFVKEDGVPLDARRKSWSTIPSRPMVEAEAGQLSEEVWAEVAELIPPMTERMVHRGAHPPSDREALTALAWEAREGVSWQTRPVGLKDGAGLRILARLREWEDMGAWDGIRSKLEELLGPDFNWSKHDPRSVLERRPLNKRQRAFLATVMKEPERRWTIEAYSARHGIRPDSGRGDLWKLAAMGLVVHRRRESEFVFEPVRDIRSRVVRLLREDQEAKRSN